ncbi:hypothetical protein PILCRDRAFT_816557 [Piloderma croceum F 1598]|uniref:F-box domain-containing protein n=1 Tax=Piloderma croceum (strain F 1598) TaxID=765440 RepID=A0A0C3G5T4_PILCF|nr:hypothetical protein PILCRDRAFT_816557 [Piloderma croceum F 1598]
MSSSYALDVPSEIWLKIASHLAPDCMYYVGGCCSGEFHPGPGAGIVGPLNLASSSPPKDLIHLSSACRTLRFILGDEVKGVLSLHMRRRYDNTLVHLHCSDLSPSANEGMEEGARVDTCEIANLPLGNHIRHLRLALRESKYHSFEALTTLSQEYCDDTAPILYEVPCLQSLRLYARFSSCGNDFNLSPIFCQALSSLKHLHTLEIWGLTIPADCPTLPAVERIQTNGKIHSFKSLPRLKDLRQAPEMFAPGYHIPKDTLARLKILHYCPPDDINECALLPQVCRELKNDRHINRPIALQELVFNGYPDPHQLLDIVRGLATPDLHTFVCFGLSRGDVADHDEAMKAVRKAFPNLTTLDFPKPPE